MGIFSAATSVEKGNKMENNFKKNADIAMARFRVQTYNHGKKIKTIAEIYGVSETFAKKMCNEVGTVTVMASNRIKCAEARRLFKHNLEHYKLLPEELSKIYEISLRFAKRLLVEVNGSAYDVRRKAMNDLVYNHPNFGVPGQHAPVTHTQLADALGVKEHVVSMRRHKVGVLPYNHRTNFLTPAEKRGYKICKLTRSWGRPAGMDRYLND